MLFLLWTSVLPLPSLTISAPLAFRLFDKSCNWPSSPFTWKSALRASVVSLRWKWDKSTFVVIVVLSWFKSPPTSTKSARSASTLPPILSKLFVVLMPTLSPVMVPSFNKLSVFNKVSLRPAMVPLFVKRLLRKSITSAEINAPSPFKSPFCAMA